MNDITPSIIQTNRTIPAGATHQFDTGGAEIALRQVEGASEVLIGMDNGELLKTQSGEYYSVPHKRFRVKNDNAVPVVVTINQSNIRGVYGDRRDTATSVSIGGSFAVVNSASTDEGGTIRQYSASVFNSVIDATGGATLTGDIITAAENVNGARIRHASLTVLVASGSKFSRLSVKVPQHIYIGLKDGADIYPDEFEIGPGVAFEYKVDANMSALISVHYDLL